MCSKKTPKQKVNEAQFVVATAIRKYVSDDPKYRSAVLVPCLGYCRDTLRNRSRAGGCVSSHGIGSLQLTKRKETEAGLQGWVFG